MLGRETLRAVQEEDRRTFAGLVHLKLHACDRDDVPLQWDSLLILPAG
jgi:hypothetical protein